MLPKLAFDWRADGFHLEVEPEWLANNPLTESALQAEAGYWKDAGIAFTLG